MSDQSAVSAKLFTVEEANAALPLVRAITQDMVELYRDMVDRRERLSLITSGRSFRQDDPYYEELAQINEELDKDSRRLQDFVEELRHLGVEPKSPTEGLVDFPSMHEGRIVYLCWKFGEPAIRFWHDLDAGFSGRQPLVTPAAQDSVAPVTDAAAN